MKRSRSSRHKPGDRQHAQASSSRSGCWSKRKDGTSNRKRVEVTSARKTRMHGVVVTGQKAHQPMVLQRVPMKTVANETPARRLAGKGLRCPEPSESG